MQKSFSQVLLLLICFIYFFVGVFHLILPKEIGLFVIHGSAGEIATLLQRFLGSSYVFTSILLYLIREQKGKTLYITIGSINIIGFIHLYLIFSFHSIINLPILYFLFIILVQVSLFIALIEQLYKR